jgi:hypothetical protein
MAKMICDKWLIKTVEDDGTVEYQLRAHKLTKLDGGEWVWHPVEVNGTVFVAVVILVPEKDGMPAYTDFEFHTYEHSDNPEAWKNHIDEKSKWLCETDNYFRQENLEMVREF